MSTNGGFGQQRAAAGPVRVYRSTSVSADRRPKIGSGCRGGCRYTGKPLPSRVMLRKKFVPPVPVPPKRVRPSSHDRQPLPERNLTHAALEYHFALRWLDNGCGTLQNFILLARHLVVARALGKLGCQRIPDVMLAGADEAITKWTRHGLKTGEFRVDSHAFEAIRCFLLAHDEQLSTASSAAVSVALADLNEVCSTAWATPAAPYASAGSG
jgi:hypothetical protein